MRTKTSNVGGFNPGFMNQAMPSYNEQQTITPMLDRDAPLRRQISMSTPAAQLGGAVLGNQGLGINAKAFATQANGMPPLFVGFLTNDASMGHIKTLLDT